MDFNINIYELMRYNVRNTQFNFYFKTKEVLTNARKSYIVVVLDTVKFHDHIEEKEQDRYICTVEYLTRGKT